MTEEKKRLWVIAVDLDGVILEFDYDKWVADPSYFGKPKPGTISALRKLQQEGYRIIIHTARLDISRGVEAFIDMLEYIKAVLEKNNIPYDSIWVNAAKPRADFYIDDKAIRFESWEQTLKIVMGSSR